MRLLLDAASTGLDAKKTRASWFIITRAAVALVASAAIVGAATALVGNDGGVGVGVTSSSSSSNTFFQAPSLGDAEGDPQEEVRRRRQRAQLGEVPEDLDHMQSSHSHAGGPPTIYIADAEDPTGDSGGFDALKAHMVSALDSPTLVGRLELVPGVVATELPVKIELLEEATSPFEDGLATICGEYVDKKHTYGVANGAVGQVFFKMDEGKKVIVRRGELESLKTQGMGSYLEEIKKIHQSEVAKLGGADPEKELTEPEKKALGTRIGASMTHLLAWTRAKKSGKKLALVMETNFNLAGLLKRNNFSGAQQHDGDDDDEDAGAAIVEGHEFESILGAVTAYHPKDADVVFLDKAMNTETLGEPVMKLTKPGKWSRDLHFVPAAGTKAGAGFYLVTEKFLDKVYPLIEKSGFHFVDEWLVRQCATYGNLKCYQTTPALGRAVRAAASFDPHPVPAAAAAAAVGGGDEKPQEDKPQWAQPQEDKPQEDKPQEDKPQEEAAVVVNQPQDTVKNIDDLFADADATVADAISTASEAEVDAAFGGAATATPAAEAKLGAEKVTQPQEPVKNIDDLFADADAKVADAISAASEAEVDAAFGGVTAATAAAPADEAKLGAEKKQVVEEEEEKKSEDEQPSKPEKEKKKEQMKKKMKEEVKARDKKPEEEKKAQPEEKQVQEQAEPKAGTLASSMAAAAKLGAFDEAEKAAADEEKAAVEEIWGGSPLWAQDSDASDSSGVDDLLVDRTVETANLGEAQLDFQLPTW